MEYSANFTTVFHNFTRCLVICTLVCVDNTSTCVYNCALYKLHVVEYVYSHANLSILPCVGHERLRPQTLENYAGTARGVIFVVDSSTITKEIKDVAE